MNKMASTTTKLPLSAPRVLLLGTAVFIFLSGSQAKESRKCYWCGPLADQVHRSQRAPPCDTIEEHTTQCDPGYTYCAIVATSPPLVESRYCVKSYQDECYSLFCNSTKTWRMTCSCRGDFCNGHNSDREKEAFNALMKLTSKVNKKRNKRAMMSLSKFVSNKIHQAKDRQSESNIINNVVHNDNTTDVTISNLHINNMSEEVDSSMMKVKSTAENGAYKNPETNEVLPTESNEDLINKVTKTTQMIDNVGEDAKEIHTTSENKVTELEAIKVSSQLTTSSMEEITKETSTVGSMVKITEKVPTAEALQKTNTVEKNTEHTKIESTLMTMTEMYTGMTIKPTESKNNTGTILHAQLQSVIAGFIINLYYV